MKWGCGWVFAWRQLSNGVDKPKCNGKRLIPVWCDVGWGDDFMTTRADVQEIVWLGSRQRFAKVYWLPVCMVVDWLRSSCFNQTVRCSSRRVSCPQKVGFDLHPVPQRHKSSIQDYNYQCWRTGNCPTNAQPMFHWNSLDTTKHGYKLATSQSPTRTVKYSSRRVCCLQKPSKNPIMQPPKPNPSIQHHTREHWPAKCTATHMHSYQATIMRLPSHRAGKHPISTPQTAVKNPMNKIGQPPERKRPT